MREQAMKYRRIRTYGGKGDSPDRFTDAVRGIAAGPTGMMAVVGDLMLKVYTGEGVLHAGWPTERLGLSVAWASDGTSLLVGCNRQVLEYDLAGKLKNRWSDPQHLGEVTSVAWLADGWLAGDITHRCIHRYDRRGTFVNDIGKDNKMKGLVIPNGHVDFAVDGEGIIHVTNPGKHRVERYTTEGRLLDFWGRFGGTDPEGFSGCCNPTNLALMGDRRTIVTEKAPPRAKVYDSGGRLLCLFGEGDFDPNCKNMDVAVDGTGAIHILDPVGLRVCVYIAVDGPAEPGKASEGTKGS